MVVIGAVGFVLFKKTQEHRILNIVREGQIVIDQEFHEWGVEGKGDDLPVKIEMYIRSKSRYRIAGTLVFLVTLSGKGIEEQFINEAINAFGEEKLRKEIKEEIDKGKIAAGSKFRAIYNYIDRGRQLAQGEEYEPVATKDVEEDYTFKFRKQVSLNSGEIIKLDHMQLVPPREKGFLLDVKIESIEFK